MLQKNLFSLCNIKDAMKHIIWVIFTFLIVLRMQGQQDPQISHYMPMRVSYNPACAGVSNNVSINLVSRNQWMKFEGAPNTKVLTVDAPLNLFGLQSGIGLKIINDQYAFVNDTYLGLMFAKFFSLPAGTLSVGIGTNLFSKEFDAKWVFPDQQEQLPTGQVKSMVLDFDIGAFYQLNNFFTGLSMTHVTAPKFVFVSESGQSQQVGLVRHYYLLAGYNINSSSTLFSLTPSTLVKSDGHIIQVDLNLNVSYNKRIWAGVSYRNGESIIAFFGTSYIKDINIGLSYDFLINSIGRASSGSFEVYVGYSFAFLKMEKPQHYHNVKTL